jgi:uncharacterized protein (TIGR02145 family)
MPIAEGLSPCVPFRERVLPAGITEEGTITVNKQVQELQRTIKYGNLYNWYAATDVRGIVPSGWHIPTKVEWETLVTTLGGSTVAGGSMKEIGTVYWTTPNTGASNSSGFNGRGAGMRYGTESPGAVGLLQEYGLHWSSTERNSTNGYGAAIWTYTGDFLFTNSNSADSKQCGYSIRGLLTDPLGWQEGNTITDYDGNIYPTVKIGTQVWMAANLIVEHYNNGEPIPNVTDDVAWAALTTGGMCYPNKDITNAYNDELVVIDDPTEFEITITGQNTVYTDTKIATQDTPAVFTGVPYDTYDIVETPVSGYTPAYDINPVTVNAGNPDAVVTITNEYVPAGLKITWDDILNVPVADPDSVSDWNTFFGFDTDPTLYTTVFSSVFVVGDSVYLMGGSGITLKDWLFTRSPLISIVDTGLVIAAAESTFNGLINITTVDLPYLISAGDDCFSGCNTINYNLPLMESAGNDCFNGNTYTPIFDFPSLVTIGDGCFNDCLAATTFDLPVCIDLGTTHLDNAVFLRIDSNTITLTVPAVLMTCNGGAPDGDITYLIANNTVTVFDPLGNQLYPPAAPVWTTFRSTGANQFNAIIVLPTDIGVPLTVDFGDGLGTVDFYNNNKKGGGFAFFVSYDYSIGGVAGDYDISFDLSLIVDAIYISCYNSDILTPPVLTGLTALVTLDLAGCTQLVDPPVLTGLTALQTLNLNACTQLVDPPVLTGLTALQSLNLYDCTQLAGTLDCTGLVALTTLNISNTLLTRLDVVGCILLVNPPMLTGCSSLINLFITANVEMTSPPGVTDCVALVNFDCSNNTLMASAPDCTGLADLVNFDCVYNPAMTNAPDVTGCVSLVDFNCFHNASLGLADVDGVLTYFGTLRPAIRTVDLHGTVAPTAGVLSDAETANPLCVFTHD